MAIKSLAEAIGYPQEVPAAAAAFDFLVDGASVSARIDAGRLVLSRTLFAPSELSEGEVTRLLGYAAGRVYREDAVLAWDPREEAFILWQAMPADASAAQLKLFFEVFCVSCDWWAARVHEANRPESSRPEMMIMP